MTTAPTPLTGGGSECQSHCNKRAQGFKSLRPLLTINAFCLVVISYIMCVDASCFVIFFASIDSASVGKFLAKFGMML